MQSSLVCSFAPFSNDQGDRGRTSASLVPASTTSLTQASSSGKVIVKLTWAISILPNHGEKSAQTRGADRQSSRCSSAAGSPLHTMVNCDDRGLTTVVQMAWFHGTGGRLRIGMHPASSESTSRSYEPFCPAIGPFLVSAGRQPSELQYCRDDHHHGQGQRQKHLPAESHQLIIAVTRHSYLNQGKHNENEQHLQHEPHDAWNPG